MRKVWLVAVLFLAACGKKEEAADTATLNKSEAAVTGPNVGVNPGNGLAVTYEYGFRLAAERIAATQEDHASQCEAAGPAICRVTGMTYNVLRDRTVAATLELHLAPASARKFGKQSVDTVVKHGGMLISARIASENAGQSIAAAQAAGASFAEEKARIEQQLARTDLGSAERRELQQRLQELADSSRQSSASKADAAAKLADTPLTLSYESGPVDQSLSDGRFVGAIKDGAENIVDGATFLLWATVSLLPWLLVGGLALWGWKRWQHYRGKGQGDA